MNEVKRERKHSANATQICLSAFSRFTRQLTTELPRVSSQCSVQQWGSSCWSRFPRDSTARFGRLQHLTRCQSRRTISLRICLCSRVTGFERFGRPKSVTRSHIQIGGCDSYRTDGHAAWADHWRMYPKRPNREKGGRRPAGAQFVDVRLPHICRLFRPGSRWSAAV